MIYQNYLKEIDRVKKEIEKKEVEDLKANQDQENKENYHSNHATQSICNRHNNSKRINRTKSRLNASGLKDIDMNVYYN